MTPARPRLPETGADRLGIGDNVLTLTMLNTQERT
jgi:hypothetical protein